MNNQTIEIKYQVNGMYAVESFAGTNTAAVINAIQARYGSSKVQISLITYHSAPQTPSQTGDSKR